MTRQVIGTIGAEVTIAESHSQTTEQRALPAGTWQIDGDHTNVEFRVRHGVTRMRGRFDDFAGTVTVDGDTVAVAVTIDAASVNTGQPDRDNHLRSGDFFDVESHPEWTFESTGLEQLGEDRFVLIGELTIRGIRKQVRLDGEFHGVLERDPWGMTRAAFTARGDVNREDYDMSWNAVVDGAVPFVGRKVGIELEVELILDS